MARYYYLGPHIDDTEDSVGLIKTFPAETIGSVDLSGGSNDCIFVTTAEQINYPGYVYLGDDLNTTTSSQQKTDWETKSNLSIPIGSYTLLDLLWNTLTIWSDPTSANRAKPITPTSQGVLELHLGGHSLIRSRYFEGVSDPIFALIKEVFQESYRKIRNHGLAEIEIVNGITLAELQQGFSNNNPAENKYIIAARRLINQRGFTRQEAKDFIIEHIKKQHRKFLADKVSKYRIEWQDLIPQDVPLESPVTPETTIGDTFVDSNTTALSSHTATGTGGGFIWSAEQVGTLSGLKINNTNSVYTDNATDIGVHRAEIDLSSDDMYTQITITQIPTTSRTVYVAMRFNPSIYECYFFAANDYSVAPLDWRLFKRTGGALTQIGSTITTPDFTSGDVIKGNIDGSSLSGIVDGATVIGPSTDTAITGYSRSGIAITGVVTGNTEMDAFIAADIYAASPRQMMHFQRMSRQ